MSSPSIIAAAIAKNEDDRLVPWFSPLQDADRVSLLDTGSTDDTMVMALGMCVDAVQISYRDHFRFDTARNALLDILDHDADYVFWVDLDETVERNWREKFNLAVARYGELEVFSTTRIWGNLAYERPTIHKLGTGWTWRRPVHEELVFRDRQEYSPAPTGITVQHHQDPSKDRSQYLPLMKLACDEDPEDTQIAFWYARELIYYGQYREALAAFQTFVGMETAWVVEKMQAHLYMSFIYDKLSPGSVMEKREIERAIAIAPWRREPLLGMAHYYAKIREPEQALNYANQALSIPHTMRPQDYLSSEGTWNDELIRKELHLA